MNLQEINFEQAKLLKQAGFVEHTTKFYDKNGVLTGSLPVNHNLHKDRFSCITVALAIQWLREQKDKDISVEKWISNGAPADKYYYVYQINKRYFQCTHGHITDVTSGAFITSREEAEMLGVTRTLEILTTTP